MSKQFAKTGVWAVEIHDLDERSVLAFDLNDVLETLGPSASTLDWIVTDYDPVTEDEDVAALAEAVARAQVEVPRQGIRLSSNELQDVAARTQQTIDGQFIGVRADTAASIADLIDLRASLKSDAELVIKAVDSSFWIVVTKSPEDVEAIRARFRDVREDARTLELGLQFGL